MLTKRQNDILRLIIQHYTSSGVPVGSKTLMSEGVKASSATIRNDMKALEDEGLLLKTHSSSGRIPSALGYRYYVDHLLKPARVAEDDLLLIRQSLGREFHEINDIIKQSAEILSELTRYGKCRKPSVHSSRIHGKSGTRKNGANCKRPSSRGSSDDGVP